MNAIMGGGDSHQSAWGPQAAKMDGRDSSDFYSHIGPNSSGYYGSMIKHGPPPTSGPAHFNSEQRAVEHKEWYGRDSVMGGIGDPARATANRYSAESALREYMQSPHSPEAAPALIDREESYAAKMARENANSMGFQKFQSQPHYQRKTEVTYDKLQNHMNKIVPTEHFGGAPQQIFGIGVGARTLMEKSPRKVPFALHNEMPRDYSGYYDLDAAEKDSKKTTPWGQPNDRKEKPHKNAGIFAASKKSDIFSSAPPSGRRDASRPESKLDETIRKNQRSDIFHTTDDPNISPEVIWKYGNHKPDQPISQVFLHPPERDTIYVGPANLKHKISQVFSNEPPDRHVGGVKIISGVATTSEVGTLLSPSQVAFQAPVSNSYGSGAPVYGMNPYIGKKGERDRLRLEQGTARSTGVGSSHSNRGQSVQGMEENPFAVKKNPVEKPNAGKIGGARKQDDNQFAKIGQISLEASYRQEGFDPIIRVQKGQNNRLGSQVFLMKDEVIPPPKPSLYQKAGSNVFLTANDPPPPAEKPTGKRIGINTKESATEEDIITLGNSKKYGWEKEQDGNIGSNSPRKHDMYKFGRFIPLDSPAYKKEWDVVNPGITLSDEELLKQSHEGFEKAHTLKEKQHESHVFSPGNGPGSGPLPVEEDIASEPVDPYVGPTERSNYIMGNRILTGACPSREDLGVLLGSGFNVFVCLLTQQEMKQYGVDYAEMFPQLPVPPDFMHCPIKDGGTCKDSWVLALCKDIIDRYRNGKKIYIHCMRGHGRSGVIAGILIGMLCKVYSQEALKMLQEFHRSRGFEGDVSTPTEHEQRLQVVRVLNQVMGLQP